MDTIKDGLAQYGDKYIGELRDEACRNLIRSSFSERMLMEVDQKRTSQIAQRDAILAEIATMEEAAKNLSGKELYDNNKKVGNLKERSRKLEAVIKRYDKFITDSLEKIANLRVDARQNSVEIDFIKENIAENIWGDFERFMNPPKDDVAPAAATKPAPVQ